MPRFIGTVPLRQKDRFPFRELGLYHAMKIYNPEWWEEAKQKARTYQSKFSGFRFVISLEWETKPVGDKFVPIQYLQIVRVPTNEPVKKAKQVSGNTARAV